MWCESVRHGSSWCATMVHKWEMHQRGLDYTVSRGRAAGDMQCDHQQDMIEPLAKHISALSPVDVKPVQQDTGSSIPQPAAIDTGQDEPGIKQGIRCADDCTATKQGKARTAGEGDRTAVGLNSYTIIRHAAAGSVSSRRVR